jgi:hypothetical protein
MKKYLLTSLIVSVISLGVFMNVSEASVAQKIVSKTSANEVHLDWGDAGDVTYKLYRDGDIIYSGKQSKFQDTNLEPEYLYTYKLATYKQNKLVDIVKYDVKTKNTDSNSLRLMSKENSIENEYEKETPLTSTVSKDSVILDWEPMVDGDGVYQIYRDNKKVGETQETQFIDNTIQMAKDYSYKIVATKRASESEIKEINQSLLKANVDLDEVPEEAYNYNKSLTKIVETLSEVSEDELSKSGLLDPIGASKIKGNSTVANALASDYTGYILRYQTFIPYKHVKSPNAFDEFLSGYGYDTYLNGNNRSFGFFENSFKTRSDVYAEWSGSSAYSIQYPDVGVSILYDNDYDEITRGTASTDGIKHYPERNTSTYIEWHEIASVGVPFSATYPNIDYRYDARMYKNGNITASGNHDKAPNHEVYLARAYSSLPAVTLHTYEIPNQDAFQNLIPIFPNEYWQVN